MQVKFGDLGGSKIQISLNFNYKVNFKDYIPNVLCVLTNELYKTYRLEFSLCHLVAPGVGIGSLGAHF